MTQQRLPWSWLAMTAACLLFGAILVAGVYIIQPFRRGLDADTGPMMWQASVFEIAGGVAVLALMGLPFVVLARFLANRSARPHMVFLVGAVAVPTIACFAWQLFWIVDAAMEPPMPIAPFEANSLSYLPNWLTLGFIALSFLAAATTYVSLTRGLER